MIGRTVSRYRVLGELGRGGMGHVFRAEDTKLHRLVALKFLPDELARDAAALDRFTREARAASALNHPNICTIYEINDEDPPFIVMELLEGTTLRTRMAGQIASVGQILAVGVQTADALEAAHARGIVHRDIKPENLFIDERDRIKVLDFGLAKVERGANEHDAETILPTTPGAVMGTVAYMSPEQARGHALDGRSDLFSLGIVLYEMSTGTRPFAGATSAVVFDNILNRAPVRPIGLRADLPLGLQQIILKLLEKDAADRYQTASALLADLRALQLDVSSIPVASTRAWPATTAVRRRSVVVGLAALIVVAAAAVFVVRPAVLWPPAPTSVAVLRFADADGEAGAQYLGEGVSTSLLNTLSQLRQLRVLPRATVSRYQSDAVDLKRAAQELGVSMIVTGRVKQSGGVLTIEAELTDVGSLATVWGDTFRRTPADLVEIQERIATAVAERLIPSLSDEARRRLAKRPTSDSEAYRLYLRGRNAWDQWTEPAMEASLEFYRQATLRDPAYALAYFGLANSYVGLAYLCRPPKLNMPLAKVNLAKALALDDTLPEAHYLMGIVKMYYDWNLAEARGHFQRALALNPGYADAHFAAGNQLVVLGRLADAREDIEQSVTLDPFSNTWNEQLTVYYSGIGDLDKAEALARKRLVMDPTGFWMHLDLGMILIRRGRANDALPEFERSVTLASDNPYAIGYLGFGQARAGRHAEASSTMARLDELAARGRYVPSYARALIHAGVGDRERALALLRAARDERDCWLLWYFILDGAFDELKTDPRYAELLAPLRASAG